MRIIYFKTLIETELGFEQLTESEQIDFIKKLIQDHETSYPHSQLLLTEFVECDGSLDW